MNLAPVEDQRARILRLELLALLAGLAALATANIARPSLPSLDDCFYARKAVELARRGEFFTVTWNGTPTFQNPPLQLWVVGRAFAALGENDAAARLPSALMALGIAVATYLIGRLTLGRAEAVTAVALLLATPLLANNARRCMMEVPLTFWVTLAVLLFVAGLRRPALHLLVAVPLGAAILTKSVLGLLPLLVMAGAAADARVRASLRSPWLWAGVAGGLALGASWPVQQAWAIGPHAVREHFMGEVLSRSAAPLPWWRHVVGYPLILLERFQPAVLPAAAGAVAAWRGRKGGAGAGTSVLLAWLGLPLLLYSLSSAQSPRYVFPLLPAMALLGGGWLARSWPRASLAFRGLVAALLALAAVVFWVRPELLRQPGNDAIKRGAALVAAAVPAGEPIPYAGSRYWSVANPFLYYAERLVQAPLPSVAEAVEAARARSGILLVDRDRRHELPQPHGTILEGRDWLLVRVEHPPPER